VEKTMRFKEDCVMPKLDKRYLTPGEFLFLPLESPKDDEPRSINTSIMGLVRDRKIELYTQIKGSFQPIVDMGKDFADTFKPYRSNWYAKRDAGQPIHAIINLFKGVSYVLASVFLCIFAPFYYIPQKNRPGFSYLQTLGVGYVYAFSWFIDGILSIVRGVTQIATTPLTWFIKMPLRAFIYLVTNSDNLLIENRPGIRKLLDQAQGISNNCTQKTREVGLERLSTIADAVYVKYTKGIRRGENTVINKGSEKSLETLGSEKFTYLKPFGFTPKAILLSPQQPESQPSLRPADVGCATQ
jgi:hypothetical protein